MLVIQSPAKYLQGPDAAALFGEYAKNLADSFFVTADDFVMKLAGDKVLNGLHENGISCHAERFNGECSHAEINRLGAILQQGAKAWWVLAAENARYRKSHWLLP
jgi:glycerol dehydrogenase